MGIQIVTTFYLTEHALTVALGAVSCCACGSVLSIEGVTVGKTN